MVDWIFSDEFCWKSPNFSDGLNVKAIVVHYSVAPQESPNNAERIKKWCLKKADRSVHFVVLRDGSVYQSVALSKKSWHAGESSWIIDGKKYKYMNNYSIGIEMDNMGLLRERDGVICDDYCKRWNGRVCRIGKKIWEPYTFEQFFACKNLINQLRSMFNLGIDRVLGHNDVSPGRKIDPGDAFPWGLIRSNGKTNQWEELQKLVPFDEVK